jgi:ribonuclease Y
MINTTLLFSVLASFLISYFYIKNKTEKNFKVFQDAKSKINSFNEKEKDLIQKNEINLEVIKEEFTLRESNLNQRINHYTNSLDIKKSRAEKLQETLKVNQGRLHEDKNKIKSSLSDLIKALEVKSDTNKLDVLDQIKSRLKLKISNYTDKHNQATLKLQKRQASKIVKELIKNSMQNFEMKSSSDSLEKFVDLTKKQFKNIKNNHLEHLELIADELNLTIEADSENNIVKVSGFILWDQEVGKKVIQKLSGISKVNKDQIQKIIATEKKNFDLRLINLGEKIRKKINVEQKDPEFLCLLGKMKFRTSYGQNILYHSFEVGYFCQFLASTLGEDPHTAFLAGFFHDFGKTVDQKDGGSHDVLGAELLKKFGFSFEVYHPAHSHHYAVPIETIIGELVVVADKISSSRQGARSESAEMYYARVEGLEKIAASHESVKKGFALSAARELRCLMDPKKIKDNQLQNLANDIVNEIQEELVFPGQIKVNLIRSVDAVQYANKQSK